ncbi:MAG: hypothetical protein K0R15_1594 [Clostridiales bacterium]|jgi:thiamine biosynthesis lipoprotein|nr:hypothetical protein [Clostridiales bacterium]
MITTIQSNKRFATILIILLITILTLSSCKKPNDNNTSENSYITKSSFKLNTIVTITVYDSKDENLLEESLKICDKYESIYSRTLDTSELYKLNNGLLPSSDNGFQISDDLESVLNYGLYYSALSKGNFDISIAPLSSLWDFTSLTPVIPSQEQIDKALTKVNYKNINLTNNSISFAEKGMALDLGAIAKGYIADEIKEYLLSKGVKSAMINLGGNVLCVGNKIDGSSFKIGIQKPFADRNELAAIMEIEDMSVVSSGIYERFITVDGKQYHHILNPSTGYSYENNLISVTIISPYSVDGDGLSTSCFALGLEKGIELINSLEGIYAVFITDDYELHYSEGFAEAIKISNP